MSRWVNQWPVFSSSDPSKVYTVSMDAAGEFACSCLAWTRARRQCKHIRGIKEGLQPQGSLIGALQNFGRAAAQAGTAARQMGESLRATSGQRQPIVESRRQPQHPTNVQARVEYSQDASGQPNFRFVATWSPCNEDVSLLCESDIESVVPLGLIAGYLGTFQSAAFPLPPIRRRYTIRFRAVNAPGQAPAMPVVVEPPAVRTGRVTAGRIDASRITAGRPISNPPPMQATRPRQSPPVAPPAKPERKPPAPPKRAITFDEV